MSDESAGNRPLIGITAGENQRQMLLRCMKYGIRQTGGKPQIILPSTTTPLDAYDGLIISGGRDINPLRYGESSANPVSMYDDERDGLEQRVIHHAIAHEIPLLGICRGMQMINITLGGTLYQEAKDVLEDFLPNKSLFSKLVGRRAVRIDRDSQLFSILGEYDHYRVNSIHHQAVKDLGHQLRVVAHEENGLIQAIEGTEMAGGSFLLGVQWHPELMLHAPSARKLFRAFVSAARDGVV